MPIDINAVKARINTVLARRYEEEETPELYWHGTSSKFVPSILANGLDYTLAKEGNFIRNEPLRPAYENQRTLGGIYFSKDTLTALNYAKDSAQKQRSNGLIVGAVLHNSLALPDEDDYVGITRAFREVTNQTNNNSVLSIFVNSKLQIEKSFYADAFYEKAFNNFRKLVMKELEIKPDILNKRRDKQELLALIDTILVALATRYLAIWCNPKTTKFAIDRRHLISDYFHKNAPAALSKKYNKYDPVRDDWYLTVPKSLKLPPPLKADMRCRELMHKLIVSTRSHLQNLIRKHKGSHTLRMMTPVRLRGRNHIVCIMEFIQYDWIKPLNRAKMGWKILEKGWQIIKIKLHYGYPPAGFFTGFEDCPGSVENIEWYDKNDKLIGTGKEVKFSTYAADPFSPIGVEVNDNPSGSDFVNYTDDELDKMINLLAPEKSAKPDMKKKKKPIVDEDEEESEPEDKEEEENDDENSADASEESDDNDETDADESEDGSSDETEEPDEDEDEDEELELTASAKRNRDLDLLADLIRS